MRRRAPFGHVRLFDGDVAQMLEQEGGCSSDVRARKGCSSDGKALFFSPGQPQTKRRIGLPDDRRGRRQPGHRH